MGWWRLFLDDIRDHRRSADFADVEGEAEDGLMAFGRSI
jgi:hypothetical protein